MVRRQRGEGSIFHRADGQWAGVLDLGWVGGKRRRKTVYGRTQASVVKKLAEIRRQRDATGSVPTASTTVEQWLTYWLDHIAARKVKPKTLTTYRTYVDQYLIPTIGKRRLDRLTPAHVRDMHSYVEDGRSMTTSMHAHTILSTALKAAVNDGRIPANVASRVDRPVAEKGKGRALSLPQARTVIAKVEGDRLASRWQTALTLGARQGECLGLRWSHVDLDEGVIDLAWQLQRIPYRHGCTSPCGWRADRCPSRTLDIPRGLEHEVLDGNLCLIRPKSASKLVPMLAPLVASMRERRTAYETERGSYVIDHDLVWTRPDGRPIDGRADYRAWQRHLAAAGIPAMPLHAARHTAATLLQTLGVAEDVRMSILGHSQVTTQRRYAHTDLTLQRQALAILGEALAIEQ
ncbi:MAG: tyrosine-type recombinase/integrase [Nocardioidaceae bacterium]